MGTETKIEWCDHTFNPWIGCTKVAAGCANCYAEAQRKRFGKNEWGPGKPRVRTSKRYWEKPKVWAIDAVRENKRSRVFCASLADVFDPEVPDDWRAELFKLIYDTRGSLDWLVLTKRPEMFRDLITRAFGWHYDFGDRNIAGRLWDWLRQEEPGYPLPNVWLGVSIATPIDAGRNISLLLQTSARFRFLSVEPLIERVDLTPWLGRLDWVIVGGESGPGARPCNVDWVRDIIQQCKAAGVPCFVKQLGARPTYVGGKPMNLRDPKGGDPLEWPEDLRVREGR